MLSYNSPKIFQTNTASCMQRSVPVFHQILTMDQPSYNFSHPEERLLRKCLQVSSSSRSDRNSNTATLFQKFFLRKYDTYVRVCVRVCVCIPRQALKHFV